MTICREVGKPDVFVTFTMDPDCEEFKYMLKDDAKWYDHPLDVCRLFIDKLKEFVKDLTEREVLGPVMGWFYCVEHQKRFENQSY
jgi:hypothetical protein